MTDPLPMTLEQSTGLVRELLAKLDADIAKDAMETKRKIDLIFSTPPTWLEEADAQRDAARTLWSDHYARVEPMKLERKAIITALANVEAMKPPQPFSISTADLKATSPLSPSKATLSRSP